MPVDQPSDPPDRPGRQPTRQRKLPWPVALAIAIAGFVLIMLAVRWAGESSVTHANGSSAAGASRTTAAPVIHQR